MSSPLGKSSAPQVLASANERENLYLDEPPLVHHLSVTGADHEVATCHQGSIARSILLEIVVPLAAVHFEDESVADQEIDATDPVDHNLAAYPDVAAAEGEARQRLDPRFGVPIVEGQQSATPRGGEKDADDIVGRQDPTIDDGIDDDDGRSQVQALSGESERRCWFVDPQFPVETLVSPVQSSVGAAGDRDS